MARYTEYQDRVPLDALPIVVGRSSAADLYLADRTVSRHHARLERRGNQVWVVDLGSTHGTFVNEVPVRGRALEVDDRIRFGRYVQYRVWENVLERVALAAMMIEFKGVTLLAGDRVLIENIRLRILPGTFMGILGPSGAGKTMLLRLLGGIRPPSRGTICTNFQEDIWQDIEQHRRHLAFIPQRDVLYPQLTIREHLEFAARLRWGTDAHSGHFRDRIKQTLVTLGLERHADKPAAVLSGGQAKRVSVAIEWLRKPELLLLDEPTAGLDPGNEARLMGQLASLAKRGSTVVCATHLMENVRLFDLVAVVAVKEQRGVLAYVGPPQNLLEHFGCRHFADLYEQLESGDWRSGTVDDAASESPSATVPLMSGPPPLPEIRQPDRRTETPPLQISSAPREQLPKLRTLIGSTVEAGFGLQFIVVLKRSAYVLWRDQWTRWMMLAQPVILGVWVSVIQFNPGKIANLIFFSLVVACWLGMNNSIRDLVRDRRHYIRDRLVGLLPETYLAVKWALFAGVGICQLVTFLAIIRFLSPHTLPEHLSNELRDFSFWWWLGGLGIVYLCGLGMALLVSTVVRTEEAAVAWLPILILPQILLSSFATGVEHMSYTDPRPFRPLVVTLAHPTQAAQQSTQGRETDSQPERLGKVAVMVDMLSMLVYTRPAILTLLRPTVSGFHRAIWLVDCVHLVILLAATYLIMYSTFRRAEQNWPVLVGY
ncbi:MAG: ATP-binding cassette domain-containing protein [Thermogutta sp.]